MSQVTDVLDQLGAGTMTLDQAITAFATVQWVRPDADRAHGSYAALAEAELDDTAGELIPGSGTDLGLYRALGKITAEQYAVLAPAAAAAINAADRRAPGTPAVAAAAVNATPPAATAATPTEGTPL